MDDVSLGEITCPSGHLVIVDGGILGMWSADRSPSELDPAGLGITEPGLLAEVKGAVDYIVTGPDADEAGRSFGRYPGRYRYDIPATRTAEWVSTVEQKWRDNGWQATAVAAPRQVPHRERARRCAEERLAGFGVFGLSAVAVGDLPVDRPLAVRATRAAGEWDGWSEMVVRVSDAPVASSQPVGDIGIDAARFAFADADALSAWQHEDTLDGLADVVFWGAVADEAAAAFGAAKVRLPGETHHGWTDLPLAEALQRAVELTAWKDADPARRFAIDFRPHSHHWQVMAHVRASDVEAGAITVGGARILFAMTGQGDGVFPVWVDRDARDAVVAIRIELGFEDDED